MGNTNELRRPTVEEAADAIVRCLTRECRRQHFAYFRDRFGEAFAKQAAAKATPRLMAS